VYSLGLTPIIEKLKEKLKRSVQQNSAQGLLFSGGLDSGILAALCPGIKAITVTLNSYGEDISYAKPLAEILKNEHYHKEMSLEEALDSIPQVIKILKSFDPAIPNDITTYHGLKFAEKLGLESVMTGDGSDELFAGYEFMQDIDELDTYIQRISYSMHFSSNTIGDFFKISIRQPYISKEFVDFCLQIDSSLKIREEQGIIWGKWILRKAYEDILPGEFIWQSKRPIEYGSGTSKLREVITSKVSDKEFEEKANIYPVTFMNKEHLYYYEVYREVIGAIPQPKKGEKSCPGCGGGIREKAFHCRVCGWTLFRRSGKKSVIGNR